MLLSSFRIKTSTVQAHVSFEITPYISYQIAVSAPYRQIYFLLEFSCRIPIKCCSVRKRFFINHQLILFPIQIYLKCELNSFFNKPFHFIKRKLFSVLGISRVPFSPECDICLFPLRCKSDRLLFEILLCPRVA